MRIILKPFQYHRIQPVETNVFPIFSVSLFHIVIDLYFMKDEVLNDQDNDSFQCDILCFNIRIWKDTHFFCWLLG